LTTPGGICAQSRPASVEVIFALRNQRLANPGSVAEALADRDIRYQLFVESAQGVRAPIDRKVASRRAERAHERSRAASSSTATRTEEVELPPLDAPARCESITA
jgi:hypothetical protein